MSQKTSRGAILPYVIRKEVGVTVLFAQTTYEQRSGIWMPTSRVDWVTSVEAATHFHVRQAAAGVLGALPFITGEKVCMIEV